MDDFEESFFTFGGVRFGYARWPPVGPLPGSAPTPASQPRFSSVGLPPCSVPVPQPCPASAAPVLERESDFSLDMPAPEPNSEVAPAFAAPAPQPKPACAPAPQPKSACAPAPVAPQSKRSHAGQAFAALDSPAPLILVHGFAQSAASWATVAVPLARSRPVYALDLVGHGRSAWKVGPEAYRLSAQGAALLDFAGRVARVEGLRPAVLGYSMGGRVALAAACADASAFASKVGALVLESTGLGPACPDARAAAARRDEASAKSLRSKGVEAFMDAWEQLPLFATQRSLPAEERACQRRARLANKPEALALSFEQAGQHVMPSQGEALAALGQLQARGVTLLYLAGALDERYRSLAALLDERGVCPTQLIGGAGHNIHLEAPEAFVRAVERA